MFRTASPAVLLGALLLFGACGSLVPLPPRPAAGDYRIQPGDTLQFVLYQERATDETPQTLVVQPDGGVMVPYVGLLQAAGRTSADLNEEITRRIKTVFTTPAAPHFSIVIYPHRVVQVLGMVYRPGQFPLVHDMRAADALALAGGLHHPLADPNRSQLLRRHPDKQVYHAVQFTEILNGADPTTNYVLEPGDLIYVPPTPFRRVAFFVEDILSPIHALIAPVVSPAVSVAGL